MNRDVAAILGGLLAAFSTIPYIIDIVKRRTKPNIVSWFTWTLLTGIALAASISAHETRTALLMAGSTVCTTAVVILGLKYGKAEFTKFDAFCQVSAILGIVAWQVFNSPSIAVVAAVVIDFLGTIPTLRHSWRKPGEETWQTFIIGVIAPLLTFMSLQTFNIVSLSYPVYLVLANASIVFIVVYRRSFLGISLARHGVHETLHE